MKTIYNQYGLKSLINADGRMTAIGVSTISDEVMEAMKQGGQDYVVIDELYEVVGREIARLVGCKDVCVTSSASAGISLTIASLLCGNNLGKVKTFSDVVSNTTKREIIIPKGHNVDYGAPIDIIIELGGGIIKEVGYANACSRDSIEEAINENTLALMYVKSHHCVQKNMPSIKEYIDIGKKHKLPVIVDASAEEDLSIYSKLGADFVCYSGAKAISGCTAGFVECSSKKYADALRLQYKGIGRAMKIGKENIMGLLKAIEIYQKNNGYVPIVTKKDLESFAKDVDEIKGLSASIIKDEAGREIYRCKINVDEKQYGINAVELNDRLRKYQPMIYLRDHQAKQNSLAVDPRPLISNKQLEIILQALKRVNK